MSKVSKAKVLVVEVSRSSLIHGMFFKSLSGLCMSNPLMDFAASFRLLWHCLHMLNVVADVRCVGIPRASKMHVGTCGYCGMCMLLNLPVGRKSSASIEFPVWSNLIGFRLAWTALFSFVHKSALDGGLKIELLWKRAYHSSVERFGISIMLLFDVHDVIDESDVECVLEVLPSI